MTTGIKAVLGFLIFLIISPFVFTPLYEFQKITHYAEHMPPEKRQKIVERAQYYGQPIASINDYEAIGRFEAWPRVKAWLPLLTINALLLSFLAFGLLKLKNWARLGLLAYCFLIILFNAWSMQEPSGPLGIVWPSVLYGSFISFGLGAVLIYLLSSVGKNYFRKVK